MNWMTWIPLLDDLYNTQVSKHLPCQEALLVDVINTTATAKKKKQCRICRWKTVILFRSFNYFSSIIINNTQCIIGFSFCLFASYYLKMLFQRKRKLFHLRLIILSHLCGFCFYEPTIDVNGIPPMVQQGKWYLLAEGWLTGNHEELLAHGRDSLKGRRTGLIHLFCIGEYGRCFLKNEKG